MSAIALIKSNLPFRGMGPPLAVGKARSTRVTNQFHICEENYCHFATGMLTLKKQLVDKIFVRKIETEIVLAICKG